jgi:hypothetical protein
MVRNVGYRFVPLRRSEEERGGRPAPTRT